MLQNMRDSTPGWLKWVVIPAIIVLFGMWGIGNYLGGSNNPAVATVNGDDITVTSFNFAFNNARTQTPSADQNALKQQVLQTLILQKLLIQSAQQLELTLSNTLIDSMIYTIPAFQVDGHFSKDRYNAILQNLGLTTSALRDQLRDNYLISMVRLSLMQSQFGLTPEVSAQNAWLTQTRAIHYVVLDNQQFAKNGVSDVAIQAYYDAHRNDFMSEPQVKLQYVMLNLADLEKSMKNKDSARAAYDSKLNQLANLAFTNPNSLDTAAKQLALQVQTSPWLSANDKNSIFANTDVAAAAFSDSVLKQGQNSSVIRLSDKNALVLRVADSKPASQLPLSAVKAKIAGNLESEAGAGASANAAVTLTQQLQKGAAIDGFLKTNHLSWQSAVLNLNDKTKLDPNLIAAVFTTPLPSANKQSVNVVRTKQGYIVFRLDRVNDSSNAGGKAKKLLGSSEVGSLWEQIEYNQYVDALEKSAKIKIH